MSDTPSTRRPYRLCRSCHQPHTTRNARCTRCQPERAKQHNRDHAFYHTPEWRTLSAQCKEDAYMQCVVCTSSNRLMAHHIIPRKQGGPDTLKNLACLCHKCHSKLEAGNAHTKTMLDEYLRIRPER